MRITDPAEIRAILETDRAWAVYALGDLAPAFFEHCDWFRTAGDASALALLYRGYERPILFTLGPADHVDRLLDEIDLVDEMFLHVRPEVVPLIKQRYRVCNEMHMWRMLVDPTAYRPADVDGTTRLDLADVPAIERLYATGEPSGESPDFFYPSMVERGVFFGLRDGNNVVAVAGTHLVSIEESVGTIGNVYTHPARRGHGLAARVTSAVTSELLRTGVRTVGLNVAQGNAVALRLYERLGFARYCAFCEGIATR